jgi:hypothetical protein
MYCGGGHLGLNVSKCFFSETTWTVETILPRNDHWKVLYKFYVFPIIRTYLLMLEHSDKNVISL